MTSKESREPNLTSRRVLNGLLGGLASSTAVVVLMSPAIFISEYGNGEINPFNHIKPLEIIDEIVD